VETETCCSAYCPDRSIVAKSRHQKTNDYSVSALVSASVGGVSSGGSYVSLYMERSDVDQLSVRRRTYMLWPGWAPVSVDSDALAEAGFYYTGDADEVRCYACRQSFSKWQHGDVPLDVHRRRCPSCPVVLALDRDKKYPPPTSSANDEYNSRFDCFGEWISQRKLSIIIGFKTLKKKNVRFRLQPVKKLGTGESGRFFCMCRVILCNNSVS